MKFKLYCLLCYTSLWLLSACAPTKNLVYFSDLKNSEGAMAIENNAEPKIQVDDLLSITVSSLNPESNALYNSGVLQQVGGSTSSGALATKVNEGYLVDKSGAITFPVLGSIQVAGLTKAEAAAKITQQISKDVKKPTVNVRFMNFKITVVGEVNRPATFVIPSEKASIIEALALAGDMTVYGRRENVLVIREKDNVRTTTRLNLNSKDVFASPYFYLQQNDIVYVEPDKARAAQTSLSRSNVQFGISIGLALVSVLTLVLTKAL